MLNAALGVGLCRLTLEPEEFRHPSSEIGLTGPADVHRRQDATGYYRVIGRCTLNNVTVIVIILQSHCRNVTVHVVRTVTRNDCARKWARGTIDVFSRTLSTAASPATIAFVRVRLYTTVRKRRFHKNILCVSQVRLIHSIQKVLLWIPITVCNSIRSVVLGTGAD
jgi:hypothetical protein